MEKKTLELPIHQPLVCPTIVGRARELAAFHTIVREVEEGHSQLILLSGEAGIGKSRLVAELEADAHSRGFLVLQGNCFVHLADLGYHFYEAGAWEKAFEY